MIGLTWRDQLTLLGFFLGLSAAVVIIPPAIVVGINGLINAF